MQFAPVHGPPRRDALHRAHRLAIGIGLQRLLDRGSNPNIAVDEHQPLEHHPHIDHCRIERRHPHARAKPTVSGIFQKIVEPQLRAELFADPLQIGFVRL